MEENRMDSRFRGNDEVWASAGMTGWAFVREKKGSSGFRVGRVGEGGL